MTNISKKALTKKHKEKLLKQFSKLFTVEKATKTESLYTDLLTDTEQVMLIKRLAIILMIEKKYSKYKIAQTLSVSESTVRETFKKYRIGEYTHITLLFKQREYEREQFWKSILETSPTFGMPSMGKDRWKSVR